VSDIEIREDRDGTDSLTAAAVGRIAGDQVWMRGQEWQADLLTPYALILTQYQEDDSEPTGPRVKVTFTVHVEEVTS
jgi:hypothetical protein